MNEPKIDEIIRLSNECHKRTMAGDNYIMIRKDQEELVRATLTAIESNNNEFCEEMRRDE